MSKLVLELRQGEMMIVNGAPIRFRNRTRIELTAKARFLFGKQIMPPDRRTGRPGGSISPCRPPISAPTRNASAGSMSARRLINEFQVATTSALAREMLRQRAGPGRDG